MPRLFGGLVPGFPSEEDPTEVWTVEQPMRGKSLILNEATTVVSGPILLRWRLPSEGIVVISDPTSFNLSRRFHKGILPSNWLSSERIRSFVE